MKDLIDNRRHMSVTAKLRLATQILKRNGPAYCILLATYYGSSAIANKAFTYASRARERRGLPGINGVDVNKSIWEAWDWSAAGEEWTPSEEWKSSLIECVLLRYMPRGGHVLEIGPGGGRWSEQLIAISESYTGIDLSASAVDHCRRRFNDRPNARFLVGSGQDLGGIDDCSVDAIWSFDVFVHINKADVNAYLEDFRRVMKPGATAVIHHGAIGGKLGGWRSDLTALDMVGLLDRSGFVLRDTISEWSVGGAAYRLDAYDDVISVFEKPAHEHDVPPGSMHRVTQGDSGAAQEDR